MRLVDALQDEREQVLRLAEDRCRLPHVAGCDAADFSDALRRVRGDGLLERLEADRVQLDERSVDPVVLDQLLGETIQRRQVRSRPDRQMHLRLSRRLGLARVDHDRARRIGTAKPVELVHPENGLRLGRVDADVEDRVAVLDVVNASRLSVTTERLLQ